MSFNYSHPDYIRFRSAIRESPKEFVALIGSGLSIPYGLPSWEELKQLVLKDANNRISEKPVSEHKEYKDKLNHINQIKDLWRSFSSLKELMPVHAYTSVIKDNLSVDGKLTLENYNLLWKLCIKGIITYNLDTCAINSYAKTHGEVPDHATAGEVAKFSQFISGPQYFVFQPHGFCNSPDSWVLTSREKEKLLANKDYTSFMQAICKSKHLFILGLNPDDFAFEYIIQNALYSNGDTGSTHYILLANPTTELIKELGEKNIAVIPYHPDDKYHTEIRGILEDLLGFIPEDIESPAVYKGEAISLEKIPSVDNLKTLPVSELRQLLNGAIAGILPDDKIPTNEDIGILSKFYKEQLEAIHMAWLVEPDTDSDIIHGYKVVNKIGKGAFGQVFKAENSETDEVIAIKILLPEVRSHPGYLSAFRRGVRSMRILTSKNVTGMVKLIDAFEIPASIFMEYVSGMTLKEAVQSKNIDTLLDCLNVLVQIGETVQTAHELEERVLHRDLKPENIILKDYRNRECDIDVVVLDFDLSWHKGAVDLSVDRAPGYAAPEQTVAGKNKKISTRNTAVDVFSYGMLAYFVLLRMDPRPNEHLIAGFEKDIKNAILKRSRSDWKYLPKYITETICRCTKNSQDERISFSSALQVFKDCYEMLINEEIPIKSPFILLEMAAKINPEEGVRREEFNRCLTIYSPDNSKTIVLKLENVEAQIVIKIVMTKIRAAHDKRYITNKAIKKIEEDTMSNLRKTKKLSNLGFEEMKGRFEFYAEWYLNNNVTLAEVHEIADILSAARSSMDFQ